MFLRILAVGMFTVLVGCATSKEMPLADASKAYQTQEPVNPKASAKTRQVLRWFYEAPNRPDKRVISGQTLHVFKTGSFYKEGDRKRWNGSLNPDPYDRIREIHAKSGYWVGIAGAEYTDWTSNYIMSKELNPILIDHSKRGGIVSLHFHPVSPVDGKYFGPGVTADLLLNPGPVHAYD
jgi:hypothetical protein